ncbi:MAG: hypothetical protein IJX86_00485 [Lachnospiraceae bacterium]|nr:hypothetical protein [Lachnospiraceae bacterium]
MQKISARTVIVTGFDVCNRVGIAYNSGGTIYDAQDGLAYYNLYYNNILARRMSWDDLVDNIDNGYRVFLGATTMSGGGHAAVIYGYIGSHSDDNNVICWDPYMNAGTGGEIFVTYTDTYFTYGDGVGFNWDKTLSYY